ncbi:hypothetical protein N9L68_04570 [bacterium]|nr:hypothetical protein [bacterium]
MWRPLSKYAVMEKSSERCNPRPVHMETCDLRPTGASRCKYPPCALWEEAMKWQAHAKLIAVLELELSSAPAAAAKWRAHGRPFA